MIDDTIILLNQVEGFIKDIYANCLPPGMHFHNFDHTLTVLEGIQMISRIEGCTDAEKFIFMLAAMFHDVGYSEAYVGHEEAGVKIASGFLRELNVNEQIIADVCKCIMATRYPQKPLSKLEYIICDADFYHFSLKDYLYYADRLRQEWEEKLGMYFSDVEWDELNLKMLSEHEYFTDYGKPRLQEGKKQNIDKLLSRLRG